MLFLNPPPSGSKRFRMQPVHIVCSTSGSDSDVFKMAPLRFYLTQFDLHLANAKRLLACTSSVSMGRCS